MTQYDVEKGRIAYDSEWDNRLMDVLNDLYSRIEELERLQRVKVSRPSLPPPRQFKAPMVKDVRRLPRSE